MKAYELIAKPENWCKGDYFKDANGNALPFSEALDLSKATAYCAMGAIKKVYGSMDIASPQIEAVERLLQRRKWMFGLPRYNDTHAHSTIVKLLKEADV